MSRNDRRLAPSLKQNAVHLPRGALISPRLMILKTSRLVPWAGIL